MRAVILVSLAIAVALFLVGCGMAATENGASLTDRVTEYHNFLLNINDRQKAAENQYVQPLSAYLDPAHRREASFQATLLQNEWLRRNLRAQRYHLQNYINIESINMEADGRSAAVTVESFRRTGPTKQVEKWVRIDNVWYRTVEYSY